MGSQYKDVGIVEQVSWRVPILVRGWGACHRNRERLGELGAFRKLREILLLASTLYWKEMEKLKPDS